MSSYHVDSSNPRAGDAYAPACPACGSGTVPGARFCPGCGGDLLSAPPAPGPSASDASGDTAAIPAAEPVSTRSRALAVAAIAAVLAALVGAFVWLTADRAAKEQFAAAKAGLSSALENLGGADSTADIRQVADSTAPIAAQTEEFLDTDPSAREHVGLVDAAAALSAIADLDSLAGDSPEAWNGAESEIRNVASSAEAGIAELGTAAEDAADRIDEVLSESIDTYKEWAANNAQAVEARDSAIANATTYEAQVAGLLKEYAGLRQELSDYITEVENYGSTVDEGYRQFADASQARRSIRDSLSALTPPAAAAGQHARLVSILGDAIAGVEAAERGLDERDCTYYGCNVFDQPSFQHFRSESSRISSAFADAMSDWTTAAEAAIDEARAMPLPDRPDF